MHSIHFIRENFEKVSEENYNGWPRTLIMIKIIDLRRTGNNARLTVECLNGKTFNFQPARREPARATAAANAAVHWTAFKVDLAWLSTVRVASRGDDTSLKIVWLCTV